MQRFRLFVGLTTACFFVFCANANEAVFSKAKDDSKSFVLTFYDASGDVSSEVNLGKLGEDPFGYWDHSGTQFWYVTGNRSVWELNGYDVKNRKPLAKIALGKKRNFLLWWRFSEDGKYLFVRTWRKRWFIDTYETETFTRVGEVETNKFIDAQAKLLKNNRVLIFNEAQNFERVEVFLIDPLLSKVLFHKKFKGTERARVTYSKDRRFVYILRQPERAFGDPYDRSRPTRRRGYITALDTVTGTQFDEVRLKYDLTPFYQSEHASALYVGSRDVPDKNNVTIWKLDQGEVTELVSFESRCIPQRVLADEPRKFASVVCNRRYLHFDGDTKQETKRLLSTPIEYATYLPGRSSMLIAVEATAQINRVDLDPLSLAKNVSPGRMGVKLGQALLEASTQVVQANLTGYYYIYLPVGQQILFQADPNNKRIYALNRPSRDVTVYDTESFAPLGYFAVGRGATAFLDFEESSYLYAVANSQLTVIGVNSETIEPALELKKGKLAGVNEEQHRFYWGPKSGGLDVYDLRSLKKVATIDSLGEVQSVVVPDDEPKGW